MFNNFKFKNNSKTKFRLHSESGAGFTIVEIIIAISILSFGIVSVYSVFSGIVILTYNISLRFTAAYLAQEGVEIVRNIRDNNFINMVSNPNLKWSAGLIGSPCNTGCQADYKTQTLNQYNNTFLGLNNGGFYSYDTGATPTMFKRKIIISPVLGTGNALNVAVVVIWKYAGQTFTFKAEEYLYNWY